MCHQHNIGALVVTLAMSLRLINSLIKLLLLLLLLVVVVVVVVLVFCFQ